MTLIVVCRAVAVRAQTPTSTQTVPPFVLQSDNGDNRLQVGALVQFDGRFVVDDSQGNVTDTFLGRRVRSILQGRVAKNFEFYLNLDFAGGAVNLRDAYLDTKFSDGLHVRFGKGKAPFGLERLHGAANLLFVERALPTTVAPDRDWQVEALGDLRGGLFSYAASVGNGVIDGGSADFDTNDSKDVTARVVVTPWVARPTNAWSGLRLAVAGSTGQQGLPLPMFRTSAQQIYFAYKPSASSEGRRSRLSPQAFHYHGPFGAFAELVTSTGRIANGGVSDEIEHRSWQVAASWVLTGEAASDRGVRPKVNLDPSRHTWGAVQVAARYHQLTVDQEALTLGFATDNSSPRARAWTAGVNWYLNPYVKWVLNFERTVFDEAPSGPRVPENLLVFRAQLSL